MTPIDEAINEILTEIGGGWMLENLRGERISTTTVGEQLQGIESFVPGWYRATLVHSSGVMAFGMAHTPGGAVADAALSVLRLKR
jgi:hypothetical protein